MMFDCMIDQEHIPAALSACTSVPGASGFPCALLCIYGLRIGGFFRGLHSLKAESSVAGSERIAAALVESRAST